MCCLRNQNAVLFMLCMHKCIVVILLLYKNGNHLTQSQSNCSFYWNVYDYIFILSKHYKHWHVDAPINNLYLIIVTNELELLNALLNQSQPFHSIFIYVNGIWIWVYLNNQCIVYNWCLIIVISVCKCMLYMYIYM